MATKSKHPFDSMFFRATPNGGFAVFIADEVVFIDRYRQRSYDGWCDEELAIAEALLSEAAGRVRVAEHAAKSGDRTTAARYRERAEHAIEIADHLLESASRRR